MAKTKIHILKEHPLIVHALPHHPVVDRAVDAVSRGWKKVKRSDAAQKLGKHWQSGEAKVDKFAAPVYKPVNKGIKAVNDYQWAHRGIVRRMAEPVAKLVTKIPGGEHVPGASFLARKQRPPKINTRKIEYGVASLSDDAAIALMASYEPEGDTISENYPVAIGAIGAAATYNAFQRANKRVHKTARWIKKNPKKSAAIAGAAAIGTLGAVAMGGSGSAGSALPANQGAQYLDPYFNREEVSMKGEKMIREDDVDTGKASFYGTAAKQSLKKTVKNHPIRSSLALSGAALVGHGIGGTISSLAMMKA
jgi:hypothetical protein